MRKILLSSLIIGLVAIPSVAMATQQDKVLLCHKTHSESNPFVVQDVNANEVESHLGNGDFLYKGEFGQHTKEARAWCANHQPGDVCNNIDGLQTESPTGLVSLDGACVEPPVVVTPPVQGTPPPAENPVPADNQPPPEDFQGK